MAYLRGKNNYLDRIQKIPRIARNYGDKWPIQQGGAILKLQHSCEVIYIALYFKLKNQEKDF